MSIQFSIRTQFSSIWPIDRTLSGTTSLGQNGPESNGISQNFSITGTSSSNCLVSYPGHSVGWSYPSAEMQSVYSTAPVDWGIDWEEKITIRIVVCVNGQTRKELIFQFLNMCISGFNLSYLCNIMAEGFRFMPLGLVRLRTFWLSAWVT